MIAPSLNEPIFRLAALSDASELARLRWDFSPDEVAQSGQSFHTFGENYTAFIQSALESGAWAVWVAERDGRLVGNVYVQLVQKVPRPGRSEAQYGYVTNVYVEPVAQGQGIGSQLMQHAVEWAQEHGLEFLIVWPSETSVTFYENIGFAHSPEAMEMHFT